ncbi:MAG: sulfatase [Myxococcales bacterium]|nr:sulfatase [Myxococcales bacterium]
MEIQRGPGPGRGPNVSLLPLGLLVVLVAWTGFVLSNGANHALHTLPLVAKAQCLLQDLALASAFTAVVVVSRRRRRGAWPVVAAANLICLIAMFDARSKEVFFQPLSWGMAVLGIEAWQTIGGAAKYYLSWHLILRMVGSLAFLNGTLLLPPLLRLLFPTTRTRPLPLWPPVVLTVALLVPAAIVPGRPCQAEENFFIGPLLRPLRRAPPESQDFSLLDKCPQPLRAVSAAEQTWPLHGAAKGRNVLLFIAESWAFDDTSLGDPARDTTPFLRELAAMGPVSGQAWSQFGHSTKAIVGILTGHFATPGLVVPEASQARFESGARELKALGYHTAFLTTQSLTFQNTIMQYERMAFDDIFDWDSMRRLGGQSSLDDVYLRDDFERLLPLSQPFFYVVYNVSTHQPYSPAGTAPEGETDHERYRRALRYSDGIFRDVVGKLKARGLLKNTIVALVGDHGDNFDDQGAMQGRGCQLTRREHLVPLAIAVPGLPGVAETMVHLGPGTTGRQIDIVPTILDLLGVAPSAPVQGRSLLGGPTAPALLDGFGSCERSAIVEGPRKSTYDALTRQASTVDLVADPQERSPTFLGEADARALRGRLAACDAYNLAQVKRPDLIHASIVPRP